jgi:hypothetical protein
VSNVIPLTGVEALFTGSWGARGAGGTIQTGFTLISIIKISVYVNNNTCTRYNSVNVAQAQLIAVTYGCARNSLVSRWSLKIVNEKKLIIQHSSVLV